MASLACRPLPIRRRVVLASNDTDRLRGNLKYIHRELEARRGDFGIVTLLHRRSKGVLGRLRTLANAIRAEYYLATSRVFVVDDYYFPIYVSYRKRGTTVVQAWHACGALKKVGFSVLDKDFGASRELVRRVAIHSNYDVCLIASQEALPHYMEAFGQPAERFVSIGIPHTDLFFDEDAAARAVSDVRSRYGLPEGTKVALYAPTFRGKSKQAAASGPRLDLETMRREIGDEWRLLLRMHPLVSSDPGEAARSSGFAVDVSDHEDVNELLLASDVLITDYSSIIFEYSLLERPMVFFSPDAEAYERERGLYIDYLRDVPGPVFRNSVDVAAHIAAAEFDIDRVRAFKARSFDVADGRASERFVDEVVLPALDAT